MDWQRHYIFCLFPICGFCTRIEQELSVVKFTFISDEPIGGGKNKYFPENHHYKGS